MRVAKAQNFEKADFFFCYPHNSSNRDSSITGGWITNTLCVKVKKKNAFLRIFVKT